MVTCWKVDTNPQDFIVFLFGDVVGLSLLDKLIKRLAVDVERFASRLLPLVNPSRHILLNLNNQHQPRHVYLADELY